MLGKLAVAAGFAAGYVLGSKAGRQRYEEIVAQARKVAGNETVQSTAGALQAKGADLVEKAKHSDLVEKAKHSDIVEKAVNSDIATKVKSTVTKDTPEDAAYTTEGYQPTVNGTKNA
jgi:hypothetical protein